MSKTFSASSCLAALLATCLATSAPSGAGAASAGHCGGLVGTYLTKNSVAGGSQRLTSRSLMSFTSSGQIFFTDSGESGEAGYAPFTDGRGAWRCLGGGKARATTLDFTLPAAGDSKPRIGRLDMNFSYDAKTKTITGTGVLYFVPLTADPMQPSELKDGRDFELTGERVEAH
jgi:hypothetical protein